MHARVVTSNAIDAEPDAFARALAQIERDLREEMGRLEERRCAVAQLAGGRTNPAAPDPPDSATSRYPRALLGPRDD